MATPLRATIEGNLGYPRGFWGSYTAAVMNRVNVGITRYTLEQLHLAPGQQVLEIGFGGGVSFDLVLPLISGGCLHGLDISADMLALQSRRRAKEIKAGQMELRLGNVANPPYADASMDRVFGVNTIYFWPDPKGAFKEMHRVLKPGGRMALGIRSKAAMEKMGYVRAPFRAFSEDDMRKLFSDAGFGQFEMHSTLLGNVETQAFSGVK